MRFRVPSEGFPPQIIVSKLSVAQSQLDSAILLWFNEGDPVSIRTLAAAAHDCFHELLKTKTGKLSGLQTWLKSKPQSFQKQWHFVQSYFKHGAKKPRKKPRYDPIYGEMIMIDAVECCHKLIGTLSPLMALYRGRFLFEHPNLIEDSSRQLFIESIGVHDVAGTSRKEFFEKLLPGVVNYLATKG